MPVRLPESLRRPARHRSGREPQVNRPQPTTPINIIRAARAALHTIVFDQPVSVRSRRFSVGCPGNSRWQYAASDCLNHALPPSPLLLRARPPRRQQSQQVRHIDIPIGVDVGRAGGRAGAPSGEQGQQVGHVH